MAKSNVGGHRAGGGIASNKRVDVRQNLGGKGKGVDPEYPGMLGVARGSHTMQGDLPLKKIPLYEGSTPPSVPLGNTLATNVGKGGPGTGRDIHASGSQHGLVGNPQMSKGKDILSEFGAERRSAGNPGQNNPTRPRRGSGENI
jgi:hypothetical protein